MENEAVMEGGSWCSWIEVAKFEKTEVATSTTA
jgi:hypothetical protein